MEFKFFAIFVCFVSGAVTKNVNVRKSTSIPLKKTDLRISVSARRSTDTHAENTTRYLLETTFTSPTVMVPTEATIRPDFPECQLIATDFAYQNDLCAGALGPESYLDLGRSRYTCLNRCGEPPEYGKGFFQCGCDVNCEAHRDCCRDMAQVCPELHNKGNFNIPKNMYHCDNFAIVYSQGDEPAPYSTESYAPYTPSIINAKKVLPFKPRTLFQFSKSLRWFKTIDPKTRLIFNELFGHNAYKSSNATPYFIPIVTGLSCTPEVAEYPVSPNALLLLPWCRVEYVRDVITNYHRPCRRYQTLTCRCNDDSLLTDHAHNACLGDKFSQNNLYRHQLWDVHLKSLELEVPESESDCLIREVNFFGGIIPRTGVTKREDITVKMRVSPVMSRFQTPSHTSEDKLTHGGARKDDDGILKSVSDISFIVDLSNTPERRFSCPSIHSRLEDCRLEECAEGGLILTGQLSHEIPVRRYCIVPVGAKVLLGDGSRAVPSCTCVRIMAVLGDLKLWSTRLQWSQTQCLIILTAFPKNHRPLDETYEFPEASSLPRGRSVVTPVSDQPDSGDIFRHLAGIAQSCPGDDDLGFKICFFSESGDHEADEDLRHCLTWGLQGINGSADRGPYYGPLKQFYLFVFILIMHWFYLCGVVVL